MFSSVLDCPACAHRFQYEHQADHFPEEITCPECGKSSACEDFSALLFCPHCRCKLKVSLNLLNESGLMCPRCNGVLNDNSVSLNEEDYESTYDGSDRPESFRRLLQDGDIFDKFRVIRLLGRGGMAEVYQAEHLLLKQQCALKLMRNNGASSDPVFIKRFLREAKLSHSLNHPNIVKVYDVGNDAKTGYFFIAMEYIEGKTLLELSRREQLSEETLKAVLFSMGNALQVLADARVVHRDIKPSNIMLDSNGVFKLMDLGIAKSSSNHAAGEMTLTMEQSTMGTPSYASPEQCQSAHSVDIRSDIYSLGATIYHAASGKLPFDGSTAVEIILKVVQGDIEPLKNLRPDLSPGFLKLVSQMMEKDPANRPESPEKFVSMLLHTHDGTGSRVLQWSADFFRKKTTWIAGGAAAAVLAGVVFYAGGAKPVSAPLAAAPVAAEEKNPEPAAPVVAEVTTPGAVASAAAAVPERKSPGPTIFDNPDMSLDEQLEFCRKRYQAFEEKYGKSTENASAKGARAEILQYRKQLLNEWQERLNYLEDRNKKIAAAKTQKYDDAAGRAFQAGFRDLTAANRPFMNDHIAHSRALSQLLRQKNIDPNLQVEDIGRNPRRGPLICVLASAMIVQAPAFLPPLLDRYVDPMPLGHADGSRNFYLLQHPRLIAYGLPACVLPRTLSVILETRNLSYNIAMSKVSTPSCKTIFFDGHDFSGSDLIAAVLHEREDLVMLMLAAGADPDWRDANGETALFATYLSQKGARFRELLLAAGANPEIRNVSGKTHQDFASVGDFIQRWEKNDLVSCRKMLSMKQVSPDMIMANGYTLLTDACRKMNIPAIKMLTQCGASPDARDRRGWTPMDELFNLLRQYKNTRRSSGRQIAGRTSSGTSAGKVNCENVYEAIRLLLTAGADLSRPPASDSSSNYLRLFLARYSDLPGWSEMVIFMLKYTKNFDVAHWRLVAEVVRYHQMIPPYVKNQIYAAMPRELRTERSNNGR